MQVLRRHRRTVSGQTLARELGVSLRTIRRDVATLQGIGADIDAEPGVGYLLRPGFVLPPLSFTEEEIQALVIGAQWVSRQTDDALARAIKNALAKIYAVLPQEMRVAFDDDTVYVGHPQRLVVPVDLSALRRALREQRKVRINLRDALARIPEQIIWPIMLGFVDGRRFIAAWCESDGEYRVIGLDDIVTAEVLVDRYTQSRHQLVKGWRSREMRPCNGQGEVC